jgi:hypothetical protein
MLGKLPHKADPRTLQFAKYISLAAVPTAPETLDYSQHVRDWPMYGNDAIGDCTCAAAGHMVEVWTALNSPALRPVKVTQASIIKTYTAVSGYSPRTGANDNGAVELDVLNYWRKTGLTKAHKLWAFAQVDPQNRDHVMLATYLFGGVYIGVALPDTAQAQTGPDKVWDVGGQPGTWGGHAVNIVAYDAAGLTCATWGCLQRMTWAFWHTYVDEAWALLPIEWQIHTGVQGFDFATLAADLADVGKPA